MFRLWYRTPAGYRVTVKAPGFSLFENRNNLPINGRRVASFFLLTPPLSYTWSHAIDNGQGSGGFNGNYQVDRGPSSLDVRQASPRTTTCSIAS